MALSTKNVKTNTVVNKVMQPGTVLAKINSIELREDTYGRDKGGDGYYLTLNLEGVDLTEQGFEGFLIDSKDESKGRYKGQIGKVDCGSLSKTNVLYSFSSNVDKNIDRDNSILAFIKTYIAIPLNKVDQVDAIEADTIEEYVSELSKELSDGEYYYFTLGGRQWMKNGYPQYNLFLPKQGYTKGDKTVIALEEENVLTFDEEKHVIKKKDTPAVDSFATDDAPFIL